MKKTVALITMLATLLILCACSSVGKVQSVHVDDLGELSTFYIYSFKDAAVDNFKSFLPNATPTSSGYIYSTEKLAIGDTIKVWNSFFFGENSTSDFSISTSDFGTNATVDDIVDTYRVKVKSKKDSYIITYFDYSDSCASNIEDLPKIVEHKIEVSKALVVIEYDLD